MRYYFKRCFVDLVGQYQKGYEGDRPHTPFGIDRLFEIIAQVLADIGLPQAA